MAINVITLIILLWSGLAFGAFKTLQYWKGSCTICINKILSVTDKNGIQEAESSKTNFPVLKAMSFK